MTKEITTESIVKHIEKLIHDCEKLPLAMELHVQRNQYFKNFVTELAKYDLVKKAEVEDAEDQSK